jgi:WD40 repeat protein
MACPRCGQRFEVPRDPSPAAVPAQRPARWWLWVAAGVLVIVTVVNAVLLLGGGRQEVPPEPEPRADLKKVHPARPPGESEDKLPSPTKVEPAKKSAEEPPERHSMDRLDRTKLDVVLPPAREGERAPPVWEGHTNHIRRVAFSNDGQFVISVSGDFSNLNRPADNSIRVWDARRGRQIHKLESFAEPLDGLAISPGGRYALFNHGGRWDTVAGKRTYLPAKTHGVFLWDIQAKHVLGPGAALAAPGGNAESPEPRFLGLTNEAFCTDFAPGRKDAVPATVVAGARGGGLILWNTATGDVVFKRQLPRVQEYFTSIRQVKFTPDGRHLVMAHYDHTLRIHRADTGEEVCPPLKGHKDLVWALDVATGRDGSVRILSGGGNEFKRDGTGFEPGAKDYAIRLWDFGRKEVVRTFAGHTGRVLGLAFCPDGRHIVSCGTDRTVRLWDLEGDKDVRVLGRHDGTAFSVAVSPDGRVCVSGGSDCQVRYWPLAAD